MPHDQSAAQRVRNIGHSPRSPLSSILSITERNHCHSSDGRSREDLFGSDGERRRRRRRMDKWPNMAAAACMAGNTPAAAAGIAPLLNKATCAFDRRAQSFPSSKLGRRPSIKHHACIVRVKGASPLFMNLVVGRGAKLCESSTPL